MNNKTYKLLIVSLILAISSSAYLHAETTANVGVVSQYHFRGIQQTAGASASAGLDYEEGAFSVGTWAADVSDGLEVDVYASYAFEVNESLSFSVGATSYQYTGDFDSAYNEINLGASISDLEVAYSIGKWDGLVGNESATESNYTILTLGYSLGSFTGTLGVYGDEAEGEYFDLVYETTIGKFDISVGLLVSGSDLNDDESIYFSFSKEIEL
ncbi:MAG: hypothetical protein COA86_18390 [Kangiella sp.]|nr:MAG: hypothetical protein COA86_18390 [Kangiella sp.]